MEEKGQGSRSVSSERKEAGGVFIIKGMKLKIPKDGLTISINEKDEISSNLVIHIGIDLSPHWLRIAYNHLLKAEKANIDVIKAANDENDTELGKALEKEFIAGMQAIMASGIATDSYYAHVKENAEIPDELTQTWRKERTARYKQMAEVFRRAFPMSQKSSGELRAVLKQNMGIRDLAVHPRAGTTKPVYHPDIKKWTEWRFVTFRYSNARPIVGLTISIIIQTARHAPQDRLPYLRSYCSSLIPQVEPILRSWEKRYGKLFN